MCAGAESVIRGFQTEMDLTKFNGYPRTPKLWGEEILLINSAAYCAKILVVEPGFVCSLHRHKIKSESFFVLEGKLAVLTGRDPSFLKREDKAVGDCVHLLPGTYHRFWSPNAERAVFLEVSTTHSDGDVERLMDSAPLSETDCQ